MFNNLWEEVQEIYQRNFGIPPHIVDKMAAMELLRMCADGRSNTSISLKFNLPIDYIECVLKEYFGFAGWKEDLDISPLLIYNNYGFDYRIYKVNLQSFTKLLDSYAIKTSFNCCKSLVKLEREVEHYVK